MPRYIGRFAPTPSGPLHLGSLYTAVASYLDARANNGLWLLRIEDIDPPREQPGASDAIIACLNQHGLLWDGDILYQSLRSKAYDQAIALLQAAGHCFYCDCSRKQLAHCQGEYSGHCRHRQLTDNGKRALRLRTDTPINCDFDDRLQGHQQLPPAPAGCCHDFVIRRRDGLYAYQLAVVVDDIAQGVTDVVRGSDILDSTFRQAWLYHYLGQPRPAWLHLPVLTGSNGQKLSKQNLAEAVDDNHPADNLRTVLRLLRQPAPPADCRQPGSILAWAAQCWQPQRLPRRLSVPLDDRCS